MWWPFRKRTKEDSTTPSWRELLEATGADLWTLRRRAFAGQAVKSVKLGLRPRTRDCVVVLGSAEDLERLERDHDLDKIPDRVGMHPKPLTRCTGTEWVRQRGLIESSLRDIPALSLRASESISFSLAAENSSPSRRVVDLRRVVLEQSVGWVVRLFRGRDDAKLERTCFDYWSEVRAKSTDAKSARRAREAFAGSFRWDGGILSRLSKSGLSADEATANAVNAMIAALDAVQALVFWTIWNLSRTDGAWRRCRDELSSGNTDEVQEEDLLLLARIKKEATQGKTVGWSGLSYLGKALAETLRVYPPVWTLPRTWPSKDDEVISSKVDVPTVNRALDRKWDPDRVDETALASFGLGKRHCPAGTAALFAAYKMIRCFVHAFRNATECDTDKAIRHAYLGPTLCVSDEQFFELELCDSVTI